MGDVRSISVLPREDSVFLVSLVKSAAAQQYDLLFTIEDQDATYHFTDFYSGILAKLPQKGVAYTVGEMIVLSNLLTAHIESPRAFPGVRRNLERARLLLAALQNTLAPFVSRKP